VTAPVRDLVFDWGDGSLPIPAYRGEVVFHTYAQPGSYVITVTEAATGLTDDTLYVVTPDPSPPVLSVPDGNLTTCTPSSWLATLTNGYGAVDQVYSFSTLKAPGLTAANTLYQRRGLDGTLQTVALTDIPGGVQAVFGPFPIPANADSTIEITVTLPQGVTGPVAGHVDYVTGTKTDPDTLVQTLDILASDDYTMTVTAGDCSGVVPPGVCSIDTVDPPVNTDVTDDNGVTTTVPTEVTTGQIVLLTGTGLDTMVSMAVVTDDGYGFPCLPVTGSEQEDGSTTSEGVMGQFPVVGTAHFAQVIVQDQANTTRCSIAVDWQYTPGPLGGDL
jgi:hypothetical protein